MQPCLAIAAQARSPDLTLVTRNAREFTRVDRLRVASWKPGSEYSFCYGNFTLPPVSDPGFPGRGSAEVPQTFSSQP